MGRIERWAVQVELVDVEVEQIIVLGVLARLRRRRQSTHRRIAETRRREVHTSKSTAIEIRRGAGIAEGLVGAVQGLLLLLLLLLLSSQRGHLCLRLGQCEGLGVVLVVQLLHLRVARLHLLLGLEEHHLLLLGSRARKRDRSAVGPEERERRWHHKRLRRHAHQATLRVCMRMLLLLVVVLVHLMRGHHRRPHVWRRRHTWGRTKGRGHVHHSVLIVLLLLGRLVLQEGLLGLEVLRRWGGEPLAVVAHDPRRRRSVPRRHREAAVGSRRAAGTFRGAQSRLLLLLSGRWQLQTKLCAGGVEWVARRRGQPRKIAQRHWCTGQTVVAAGGARSRHIAAIF